MVDDTPYAATYDASNALLTVTGNGIYTTPTELARWGDQYRKSSIITADNFEHPADEGTGEYYAAGLDLEVDGDLNHDGRFGGIISTFTVS